MGMRCRQRARLPEKPTVSVNSLKIQSFLLYNGRGCIDPRAVIGYT